MVVDNKKEKAKHKSDGITGFIAVFEELGSALVMALLIIGFVVQPFIIPTGSMAETLKGAHFRLCCPQCGHKYDRDYSARDFNLKNHQVVRGKVKPPQSRCPSCGYNNMSDTPINVTKGDKILAIKSLYNFFEPKRWDVVVFKNPVEPEINYIKRLIGRPNETVEIVHGDIYIDGLIARKPPKVQQEMWMLVYDSEKVPVKPDERRFNSRIWQQPMVNYGQSQWKHKQNGGGKFELDDVSGNEHRLAYDTNIGNDFRTTYGYNDMKRYGYMPICSDLKVCFEAKIAEKNQNNLIGAGLRKYQRYYKAYVTAEERMVIAHMKGGYPEILAEGFAHLPEVGIPVEVSFTNVDHILTFKVGADEIEYDFGREPDAAGSYMAEAEPEVEIIGAGDLSVSHIQIFRDQHYTDKYGGPGSNAVDGPMTLNDDEFFVLGDNSPASFDSRWWGTPGVGNNGKSYRVGIVPRDYMMGKALVVFWPGGYRLIEKFLFRIVPNLRGLKLIYGGSSKNTEK